MSRKKRKRTKFVHKNKYSNYSNNPASGSQSSQNTRDFNNNSQQHAVDKATQKQADKKTSIEETLQEEFEAQEKLQNQGINWVEEKIRFTQYNSGDPYEIQMTPVNPQPLKEAQQDLESASCSLFNLMHTLVDYEGINYVNFKLKANKLSRIMKNRLSILQAERKKPIIHKKGFLNKIKELTGLVRDYHEAYKPDYLEIIQAELFEKIVEYKAAAQSFVSKASNVNKGHVKGMIEIYKMTYQYHASKMDAANSRSKYLDPKIRELEKACKHYKKLSEQNKYNAERLVQLSLLETAYHLNKSSYDSAEYQKEQNRKKANLFVREYNQYTALYTHSTGLLNTFSTYIDFTARRLEGDLIRAAVRRNATSIADLINSVETKSDQALKISSNLCSTLSNYKFYTPHECVTNVV